MFVLSSLLSIIDNIAPFDLAEPWDNVGIQVGPPQRPVGHAMFALEVSPAVIREAVSRKADTLVTHHPLIFHPLKRVDENVAVHHLVAELIRNDLALIAAHTNLDASPHGTNAVIAEMLGLNFDGALFPVRPGDDQWGLGCRAELKKPQSLRSLGRRLKRVLGCPAVQLVGDPERMVRRLAICTGAGTDIVRRLPHGEFDVLITGEINHHGAVDAETAGTAVLCAGHYETEAPAMDRLAALVSQNKDAKKAKLKVSISKSQKSPIKVV